MPVQTSTITLSSTPQIVGSRRARRSQVMVQVDSGTMYIGGPDVTTSTGRAYATTDADFNVYALFVGDTAPGEEFWVVGTGVVRVLEIV